MIAPRTRSAPLPLVGRGWGWGSKLVDVTRATTTTPTPALRADPPHKGEGKNRARGGSRPSLPRVLIAPHARTRARSRLRAEPPSPVVFTCQTAHVSSFRGAFLRPGFVSFASRTRIEGWRSAERRTDACEASGGPALSGQARHLARRRASPTG